jgi:hypothetical protein
VTVPSYQPSVFSGPFYQQGVFSSELKIASPLEIVLWSSRWVITMAEKAFVVLLKLQTNLTGFYHIGLIFHFVVKFLNEFWKMIKFCFFIILKTQQNKLCPWGLGPGVFFSNLWFESLVKLSKFFAFGLNLKFSF